MEHNLGALFKKWHDLNTQVAESFGQFNFDSIKEIRTKQRKIEDSVFSILIENAPEEIKKILPDECGEMEIGYNIENNQFYYVMFDPNYEEGEDTKLIAITINSKKKVTLIKDFKEDF
ncbi:MAG: hypothetical protein ACFFDO_09485 [Candidatus Thorarchaeota archaeon]